MRNLAYLFILLVFSGTVSAESKTITSHVPSMYCALCPITVSKALKNVEGVATVNASIESKSATVTFDDVKTNGQSLIAATTNAGFPSSLQK